MFENENFFRYFSKLKIRMEIFSVLINWDKNRLKTIFVREILELARKERKIVLNCYSQIDWITMDVFTACSLLTSEVGLCQLDHINWIISD